MYSNIGVIICGLIFINNIVVIVGGVIYVNVID